MDSKEEKFKEYSHLNNHYLKISLSSESLTIFGLNTELLDNNIYIFSITSEEIKQYDKFKDITLNSLYEKIIELIEKNKYLIHGDKNCLALSLYEGEKFDINKDHQFFLIKSSQKENDIYEKAMKRIISSLKKENTDMKKKLELVRKRQSADFLNNPEMFAKTTVINSKTKSQINEFKNTIDVESNVIKKMASGDQIDKNQDNIQKKYNKKKTFGLNISALAKLSFDSYPMVELCPINLNIVSGYAGNSFNGIVRKYNEDKIRMISDYKLNRTIKTKKGEILDPKINYFAIYDGHGGKKCSSFLQENLHKYIFDSKYFPLYTIQAISSAYIKAEDDFFTKAVDENGKIIDRSGSCAVSVLILDEWCFIINLGDSRGLYSCDSGNELKQITRDHKPNDPIEKERIEKAGGKVYKDDFFIINGQKVPRDEKNLPPGVEFPYRMIPGNIAVSNIINIIIIYSKFKGSEKLWGFSNKGPRFWRIGK